MWLSGIAGQDQAAGTRREVPRHGRGVLVRCAATNSMVTTAIEKECKGSVQISQIEHIGDHEVNLNSGGLSAFFRLLHGQRSQIDADDFKALLGQPDTIGSRSTAYFERATRLNCTSTDNTLQFRRRPPCVPGEITIPVAIVPASVLCHGVSSRILHVSEQARLSGLLIA